jgi:competence protein ComEC
MNLIPLAIAWMLGILAADIAGAQSAWMWPLGSAGILIGGVGWRLQTRPWLQQSIVALGVILLGAARICAAQTVPGPADIAQYRQQDELTVVGWVAEDPRRSASGQQVTLTVETVTFDQHHKPSEGLVLVTLPAYPEVRYGQRIQLTGQLQQPQGAERPGGFDYQRYLYRKHILVTMREPILRILAEQRGIGALRTLLDFRDHCKMILMHSLPEPQAAIAIGILLGLQSAIPADVYETFSITGTSHILVVSGWNFTIIAAMLAGLTTRLGLARGATLVVALVVLWLYALFVGATGTVLRAALMASLVVIARATERNTEGWRLLAAACWGLSLYNPHVLWDLGFELSALATASLFAYGTPMANLIDRIPLLNKPGMAWASEALTATLAAQILALPIIVYHFGNLSLIAPVANIMLVPVVPYAMLLGSLALAAGLIWLPIGQIAAVIVWAPLAWLTEGARLLAQLPGAAVQLPPFPLSWLLFYYAIVVGGWWWHISDIRDTDEQQDADHNH